MGGCEDGDGGFLGRMRALSEVHQNAAVEGNAETSEEGKSLYKDLINTQLRSRLYKANTDRQVVGAR